MIPGGTISKSDIEVLSQLIDDDTGTYRIRAAQRVYYLIIATNVFDDDTMCRPYLLIPALPDLPTGDWIKGEVYRQADRSLASRISWAVLPATKSIWHATLVDVLSLVETKRHRSGVHEVLYQGRPAVAKIACFEWDIPRIERETCAYLTISQHEDATIAPAFLGHVMENGRVMGMLLEKVQGEFASIADRTMCEKALRRLHRMGLVHGDINRYNFMVDRSKNCVRLVDFEHAEPYETTKAVAEIESLRDELAETSGRGGRVVIIGKP